MIQHGDYVDWIAEASAAPRSGLPTREALGIPTGATVFLAFGLIRPYKGIDLLIEEHAMERLAAQRASELAAMTVTTIAKVLSAGRA